MFRSIIKRTLAISVRNASTGASKERWDLSVGVLIERLPIVSKKLTKIEAEFAVIFLHQFIVINSDYQV